MHRKGERRNNIGEGRRVVARVHKVVMSWGWGRWRRQNVIERIVQHAAGGIKVCGWRWWRSTGPGLLARADVWKDVAQVEVGNML